MKARLGLVVVLGALLFACQGWRTPRTLDISKNWRFAPDRGDQGLAEKWYAPDFDDSAWDTLDAGMRWEDQGYPDLDGFAWYRKWVDVPSAWKGRQVWIKFGAVNDAYELFVNGRRVGGFGKAHESYAGRPSFLSVTEVLRYGKPNLIALRVNDWGNSGGLWRLPVVLTTVAADTELYRPLSTVPFDPERAGYRLVWHDEFSGNSLDTTKWEVRGVGPRRAGFVSPDAVEVHDGYLYLRAFVQNDSLKVGIVGTEGRFETTYGYFECRAKLPKTTGPWAAFWIQSPRISQGEDPGRFGTEIDIFEYFRSHGVDLVSHTLHWAYGPHQKTSGPMISKIPGIDRGFHTFAVEWTPEKYAFFVDGLKYHEYRNAISHIDEYVILSFEPCGEDGLRTATLPDSFLVDYVRVYKKK